MERRDRLSFVVGLLAITAGVAGCGGSSRKQAAASVAVPAPVSTTATAPPPVQHLRIVAPGAGARTGQTVVVHIVLSGTPPTTAQTASGSVARRFLYVLDHRRPKPAGSRFVLRGLTPGRHVLVVLLARDRTVRASRTFTVRRPHRPPTAPGGPAPANPAAQAPASASAPAPAPVPAPAPAPAPTPAPAPSPPPTTSTPPPSTAPASSGGGIPQNNGGDMDGDNNGGPSDGDGNV